MLKPYDSIPTWFWYQEHGKLYIFSERTIPVSLMKPISEPEFVKLKGAQESIPPTCVAWRAGTTDRVVVPASQAPVLRLAESSPWNRYKHGLRVEEKSFTSSSNICQEVCCTVDRWGQARSNTSPLTTTLYRSWSLCFSYEDDVTVILLLGVPSLVSRYFLSTEIFWLKSEGNRNLCPLAIPKCYWTIVKSTV
jgi:hypothetical protein